MSAAARLERPAEMRALPELLDLVEREAAAAGLPPSARFDLRLAVEELCTNVIRHGYRGLAPGPIAVECRPGDRGLTVVVEDRAAPFDAAEVPQPDLDSDWRERRIGGLGFYLAARVTDSLSVEPRPGGGNRAILFKRFPGDDPG